MGEKDAGKKIFHVGDLVNSEKLRKSEKKKKNHPKTEVELKR